MAGPRRARRIVAALLLGFQAAGCVPPHGGATGIAPGDTVRVTAREHGTVRGEAVLLQQDTLTVQADTGRVPVPVESIDRLQVRAGTHGHAGYGFLIGAVGLSVAVVGLIAASSGGLEDDGSDWPPAFFAMVYGGLAFVLGGGVGAVVGSAVRHESWDDVPASAPGRGWTYAVEPPPSATRRARESRMPVADTTRVALAARVRLVLGDGRRVELTDAWVARDSVGGLTPGDADPRAVARGEIERVLAPRGRHGHATLGAGIGFAAGLLGGAIAGKLSSEPHGVSYVGLGALVGGTAGALIGLAVGSAATSDSWVPVDLDAVNPAEGPHP